MGDNDKLYKKYGIRYAMAAASKKKYHVDGHIVKKYSRVAKDKKGASNKKYVVDSHYVKGYKRVAKK